MANDSTSVSAFTKNRTQSGAKVVEQRVLDSLHDSGPGTRLDLANRLGKPINCITAPVLALIKAGLIEEHDKVVQPETGNKAWQLRIKEEYA